MLRRAVSTCGLAGGLARWPSKGEPVALQTCARPCTGVQPLVLRRAGSFKTRDRSCKTSHDESRAPRPSLQRPLSKPATIPYDVHTYAAPRPLVPARRHTALHHTGRLPNQQLLFDKSPVASLLWPSSISQPSPEAPCRNRRCADSMQILRVLRTAAHSHVDHATSRIGRASLSGNGFPIERSPNKSCRHNAS